MLTLIPWMFAGLIGIVVTAILLAAEWYIWDSRYTMSAQLAPALARVHTAHHEEVIQVPSASGRDVVVTLAAQLADRNSLAVHRLSRNDKSLGVVPRLRAAGCDAAFEARDPVYATRRHRTARKSRMAKWNT